MNKQGILLIISGPSGSGKSTLLRSLNLLEVPKFNHQVKITRGVLQEECSALLTDFFRELRKKKKEQKKDIPSDV